MTVASAIRFAIGEIAVDVIVDDDDFELPLRDFLPGLDLAALAPERGWLESDFVDRARDLEMRDPDLRLAHGRANHPGRHLHRRAQGPPGDPGLEPPLGRRLARRLRGAGIEPAAVDAVFCTHLHIDHVGWNTGAAAGSWAATFPSARYLVGRSELADWQARMRAGTAPELHVRGLEDSVLPLVEAGPD